MTQWRRNASSCPNPLDRVARCVAYLLQSFTLQPEKTMEDLKNTLLHNRLMCARVLIAGLSLFALVNFALAQ